MIRKIIITGLVIVAVGVVVLVLLKMGHGSAAADTPEEKLPTVVTVQTGQIKRVTLHGYVEGFGGVGPAAAAQGRPPAGAHVAPPVPGVVKEVKISEGQHVDEGSVLFQLDSRVADVAVDFARKALERQQKLLELNNTSQKAVQDAEQLLAAAQAQQALLCIKAPLSGTVTHLNIRPGEAVDVTTTLADITDLNRLEVTADIPSAQAGALKAGQTLELLTEPPATTSLSYISPTVNFSNDTVQVRAALPTDGGLRPGQFVRLRVVTAGHTNCLAAPSESVVTDDNGQSVIAVVTGDQAGQVSVKTGLREKGLVEVEGEGLKEGQTVVTVGAYGLPEKTKIVVANASGSASPSTNSEATSTNSRPAQAP
jgi:RND family efflux transporter MFP subunit